MMNEEQGALAAAGEEQDPMAEEATEQQPEPTEDDRAMFGLVVGRATELLSKDPEGLDAALKADPVRATVSYGTKALYAVAGAAEESGRPVSFEVLIQAGMQVIKVLGAIANEKGYLADEEIEVFLKEAFQQSISKYTQMDMEAGRIDQKTMDQVGSMLQGGQPEQPMPEQPGVM